MSSEPENAQENNEKIEKEGNGIKEIETRKDAILWTHEFHNKINSELDKKDFSKNELKQKYDF